MFLNAEKTIKQLWQAEWIGTPTFYDNDTATTTTDNSPWVRLSIREGLGSQISLGLPSLDRHSGVVFVNIFVPLNEGSERARWLADKVARVFRKKSINYGEGSLVFDVPYIIGADTDADDVNTGWWQLTVLCPYTFDEVT